MRKPSHSLQVFDQVNIQPATHPADTYLDSYSAGLICPTPQLSGGVYGPTPYGIGGLVGGRLVWSGLVGGVGVGNVRAVATTCKAGAFESLVLVQIAPTDTAIDAMRRRAPVMIFFGPFRGFKYFNRFIADFIQNS